MKKLVIIAALLMAVAGVKAQDCEALVLPYFGSQEAQDRCPTDKVQYYCVVAQSAFYESDTVPSGARVVSIGDVWSIKGNETLPNNYVVNLNSLSYFAYCFKQYQLQDVNRETCFSTPNSAHAYLVLRSYNEMMDIVGKRINELQTR